MSKGLINGGVVGLTYILALYMLSSFANGNFSLNLNSVIVLITSILAGVVGGIIGVNFQK